LDTTGYAAAQVWYRAEFAVISPGHLVDLERVLQHTVDGQPPRPDGAALGWLHGFPYRLLAGHPAKGGFGLLAPRELLLARGALWATKLLKRLCPPVLHLPYHPPPPSPPIRLTELEELPGGVRPMYDQPAGSDAQATLAAAAPVPAGWAQVVLLHVCPSLHPLQTQLCATFCEPEAVVSGLLPIVRDQRMLVLVGALRRMLLAIACLGHIEQRSWSDLPQLRAGVLQWLTSPGLPAVEVSKVTASHLVWTHQTTDDSSAIPCWVLGLPSLLATPALSSLVSEGQHAVRPIASLLSRLCDTVPPLGTWWTRPSPPSLAALVGCGESRGRMGTMKSIGTWLPMV
jgi:hypothetical protein